MADRIALVDDDQNILTSVALALEAEGLTSTVIVIVRLRLLGLRAAR